MIRRGDLGLKIKRRCSRHRAKSGRFTTSGCDDLAHLHPRVARWSVLAATK